MEKRGSSVRIYVDADGCPQEIMSLVQTKAIELNLEAIFVTSLAHVRQDERWREFQFLVVDQLPESVDMAIANLVQPEDLVITQDYGLAALALSRGAFSLSPRGLVYTNDNIGSLLSWRHLSAVERRKGGRVRGGIKDLLKQDMLRFAEALTTLLPGEPDG